jgi:hypothetical protein
VPPPTGAAAAGAKAAIYARFIPREELSSFAAWAPGDLSGAGPATPGAGAAAEPMPAPVDPVEQQAELVRQARQSGYQDGYRDGLVALEGFKQSFAHQATLQVGQLVKAIGSQLDAMQQEMAEALAATALALARQIVRSELAARPESVAAVAQEALETLMLSARHITLRVHPDDQPLVAEGAGELLAARGARSSPTPHRSRRLRRRIGHRPGRRQHRDPLAPCRRVHRPRRAVAGGGRSERPGRCGVSVASPLPTSPAEMVGPHWRRYLANLKGFAADEVPLETQGLLVRVTGLVLEAAGIRVPVGSVCEVRMPGQAPVLAEVVGFSADCAYLMPTGDIQGLASGARVVPRPSPVVPMKLGALRHPWRRNEDRTLHLPVGDGLLGRVVDSHGTPMDRKGPIGEVHNEPLTRRPINAMDRDPVRKPLDTGVRAINAMLTVGRGQRIGLFAGTGVGKSVLLGMMARYTAADVIVVGLIGERGREVKEFIEDILGEEGLRRAVVVAAPADAPPLVRMQGANYATVIAEHFATAARTCCC